MQIVIDIPAEDYEIVKEYSGNYDFGYAIKKGIVLPKGHGRLIDAKALETTMYHEAFETDSDMQKWDSGCWIRYKMFENAICDVPTIIEADKG